MSAPQSQTTNRESSNSVTADEKVAAIAQWLRLLKEPGQVTELRALEVKQRWGRPQTVAGFFDYDHLQQMAKEALILDDKSKGIYFTLNPLNPDLLARRSNRLDVAESGLQAADKDVLRRHWLLVDADPVRISGVSATDQEKSQALDAICALRDHLHDRDWPAPILADSGNGYHLLYRIDLPADDGEVVKRGLEVLAHRFDTAAVKIDTSVYNTARICKLYGTHSRKGDNTPSRPHRCSAILEVPQT